MRIVHEGDTLGITKYLSKGRSRTDMVAQGMTMSMIELGDADQTTYSIMPAQKMAMKQSGVKGMKPSSEIDAPPADIAGHVKLVGSEMIGGRRANKYRVDVSGETAYAWNDPVTGAPLRMESSSGSIEWSDVVVGPQKDELFTVPKGYQTMDMDEMRSMMGAGGPLGAMGGAMGVGGIGGMAKSQLAGMGMQAAQSYGGSLGAAAGASLGGPLGAMAGQYIGSKVAGWIADKATNAIAPGPAGFQAPRKK
jgi:hypothetical protein